MKRCCVFSLVLCGLLPALATNYYWTGRGGDNEYTNPENWVTGSATSTTVPTTPPKSNNYSDRIYFTDAANPVSKDVHLSSANSACEVAFMNTAGWHFTGGALGVGYGFLNVTGSDLGVVATFDCDVNLNDNNMVVGVPSGSELVMNRLVFRTNNPSLNGGGVIRIANPFTVYVSSGAVINIKGGLSLIVEAANLRGSASYGNTYYILKLCDKASTLTCKSSAEAAEALFGTTKMGYVNYANGFDPDNYELFATMVDEDHVRVALRQKGVAEGDPFVLGVPSGSGSVEDGITMKCAITGYNTTAPVTLKLLFGLNGETLSQVTSFDVTGDGVFTYTVTDDLEYATKYDFQFVCEGTDGNGEPFVRDSVVYSIMTPGDFTWVVPAPEEGEATASDWHVAANWDKNRRPPALGNMTIPTAAIITAAEPVQAETLAVTGVYQKVTLQPGSYTVNSRLQIGSSYEYDYTLWRDRGHSVLELLDGTALSIGGDLYLERSSGNRLVVNRGATVTGASVTISYAKDDGLAILGGSATFAGALVTRREQFTDNHKGSSIIDVADGGSLTLGALTLGWNDARVFVHDDSTLTVNGTIAAGGGITDGGNDNRIYVTNATVRASSIAWPSDGRVSNMKFYLVETKPGATSVTTTGNVMIGQSGDQRNAGQNCNNFIALEGGALSVGGSLSIGNYAKPLAHYNNYLQVAGKTARVTANALTAYGDGSIRLKWPREGFDSVPVTVTGNATFNTKTVTDGESERIIETYLDVDLSEFPGAGRLTVLSAGAIAGLTADRVRITPYHGRECTAIVTATSVEVKVKSGMTLSVR